jgi:hypothetical protein
VTAPAQGDPCSRCAEPVLVAFWCPACRTWLCDRCLAGRDGKPCRACRRAGEQLRFDLGTEAVHAA